MTAPTPPLPTFVDDQVVDADDLNSLSTQLGNLYTFTQGGFLTDRPIVSVGISRENREIPTNQNRQIQWDFDELDTDHMWSGIVSEALLLNTPGVYRVGLHIALQPATTTVGSIMAARISALPALSGTTPDVETQAIAAGFGTIQTGLGGSASCSTTYTAPVAGHALRAWCTHTGGVTAALDPAFGGCRFWAVWLGPP